MSEYACRFEQFMKDVAGHSMNVLLDNGIYRHLDFSNKGSFNQRFQITTWPGYLCISGDMGCYVFSRTEDMFRFFRKEPGQINPSYWSEKLQSDSKHVGSMAYSPDLFCKTVKEYFEDWVADEKPTDQAKQELWARIEEEVLSADNEYEAHAHASGFEHEESTFFQDFWEHKLQDYTGEFIWCLYAIVYAIHQYDNRPQPAPY